MNHQLYIARKEKRMKQADVANLLHITKQTYHLKESGKKEFKISEAKRLARIFGCSLNDLFWEDETNARIGSGQTS